MKRSMLIVFLTVLLLGLSLQLSKEVVARDHGGPGGPDAPVSLRDSVIVRDLLRKAATKAPSDSVLSWLNQAVNLSKAMDYKSGLERSYRALTIHHNQNGNMLLELDARLNLIKLLQETMQQQKHAREKNELGDFYYLNRIYRKAKETYLEILDYTEQNAPALYYETLKELGKTEQAIMKFNLKELKAVDKKIISTSEELKRLEKLLNEKENKRNRITRANTLARKREAEGNLTKLKSGSTNLGKIVANSRAESDRFFNLGIQYAQGNNIGKDLPWLKQQLSQNAVLMQDTEKAVAVNKQIVQVVDSLDLPKQEKTIAVNNAGYATALAASSPEEYIEADILLDKAASLTPKKSETAEKLAKADALYSKGFLLQKQNKPEEAIEAFEEAAALYDDENMKAHQQDLATTYNVLARIYYQQNDAFNSNLNCDKAIEVASNNQFKKSEARAWYTKFLNYQALYEFQDALESYTEYKKLNDDLELADRLKQEAVQRNLFLLERQEKEFNLELEKEKTQKEKEAALAARADAAEADRLAAEEREKKEAALRREAEEKAKTASERQKKEAALRREAEAKAKKTEAERIAAEEREKAAKAEAAAEEERRLAQIEKAKSDSLQQAKTISDLEIERQRASVRSLIFLAGGLGLLILLFLFFIRQLRRKNKRIARQNEIIEEEKKRVEEQNVIIAQEKDKSEKLLLNILPEAVADELKEKGKTTPRQYDEISVVFTDFKGFTKISERLSPTELVEKLDEIFLEFDKIGETYHMNRIKTIGDAYMSTCGLPTPEGAHADYAVQAAIEMRDFIERFNSKLAKGEPRWEIRIGVNSGPVVAGVVGIKKFAYDIWGDTVNTASRMESSGEIRKVNVSGATYQLIKGRFKTEYRGKVQAKNKGEIDMYFVEPLHEKAKVK